MNPLFEQLIYKPRTRRQFTLLEILEQNEHVTGKTFVEKTRYTRRTILKDIKDLKALFGSSVLWIGDETGYHFSLKDPYAYEQKKQSLLAEEPLFVLIDRVASGHRLSNTHWAQEMGVSSASFGRMKHTSSKWC
ncbi:HTH domain-containing protein [Enterococcus sp. NPDC086594]|uniref:HTH domain-containing protein n=1 Tax=Enterococcus sp. NPDC086594 TaxID=3363992 RepID=UPI0037F7B236